MFQTPAINLTDGYKCGHVHQMPKEVFYQLNNFTPRKTRRENVKKIMLAGPQFFVKKYLIQAFNETFFNVPKAVAIAKYKRRIDNYLGVQPEGSYQHIEDLHDLGYLPIKIKALKEGTRVNIKVPPLTIESTIKGEEGKKYVWIVGYLETLASDVIWPMCTTATTAFEFRKMLDKFAMETVGNTDFTPWQGHDFSMRGMFGPEAAEMSGAAHLFNFVGSDTIPAIDFLEQWYNADSDKEIVAQSVAATEHSVMCLGTGFYIYNKAQGDWSKIGDAELSVFKRLITEVCPNGIISIVSDTFNLWTVLNKFLPMLKKEILARDGKIVIRPDSGDPTLIMTGTKLIFANKTALVRQVAGVDYHKAYFKDGDRYFSHTAEGVDTEVTPTTEELGVVESLWNTFGGTVTEKGYRLLDSHVGSIYGDSINLERGTDINQRLKDKGFASINWIAGLGSYSYQYVTRDTDGWAMKATDGQAILDDGTTVHIPVFKDPITDDGTKKSARGMIQVVKHITGDQMGHKVDDVNYQLKDQVTEEEMEQTCLEVMFEDGKLVRDQTLAEIRAIVAQELKYAS